MNVWKAFFKKFPNINKKEKIFGEMAGQSLGTGYYGKSKIKFQNVNNTYSYVKITSNIGLEALDTELLVCMMNYAYIKESVESSSNDLTDEDVYKLAVPAALLENGSSINDDMYYSLKYYDINGYASWIIPSKINGELTIGISIFKGDMNPFNFSISFEH